MHNFCSTERVKLEKNFAMQYGVVMVEDNSDIPDPKSLQGIRNIPYSMQHYMQEKYQEDQMNSDVHRSGPSPLPVHLGLASLSQRDLNSPNHDKLLTYG